MPKPAVGRVSIDDILEAARGLEGVAVRTSLVPVPALSDLAGHPVYLKLENQQPSGTFKLRGAWTAVRRMPEERRSAGVITYSSGNHGQAVAFAANRMGVRAVIVMPETAPAAKIEGVKRWGGEVEMAGTTSEDRLARANEIIAESIEVQVGRNPAPRVSPDGRSIAFVVSDLSSADVFILDTERQVTRRGCNRPREHPCRDRSGALQYPDSSSRPCKCA